MEAWQTVTDRGCDPAVICLGVGGGGVSPEANLISVAGQDQITLVSGILGGMEFKYN